MFTWVLPPVEGCDAARLLKWKLDSGKLRDNRYLTQWLAYWQDGKLQRIPHDPENTIYDSWRNSWCAGLGMQLNFNSRTLTDQLELMQHSLSDSLSAYDAIVKGSETPLMSSIAELLDDCWREQMNYIDCDWYPCKGIDILVWMLEHDLEKLREWFYERQAAAAAAAAQLDARLRLVLALRDCLGAEMVTLVLSMV